LVRHRQITVYLIRKILKWSYPKTARQFRQDHTTVLYGFRKIEELMAIDPAFAAEIETLEQKITGAAQ